MQVIILALFSSLPVLWNATLLLFFFLFSFSILGLQMFKGDLHQRCYILNVQNVTNSSQTYAPTYTSPNSAFWDRSGPLWQSVLERPVCDVPTGQPSLPCAPASSWRHKCGQSGVANTRATI